VLVSGDKQQKKDGGRKEKKAKARKRDFEQPIRGAVSPQRAQDTSNFTDGEIAGPDWKEKIKERG
jgi:hypothetical protein